MSSEPYLIAHRVRGEPAFDIAIQMVCPECDGEGTYEREGTFECHECDNLGYWWIVPTSGHRAYPFWSDQLEWYLSELCDVPPMPDATPDHYPSHSTTPKVNLVEALGLKPRPQKIDRRI
jgi:hypothetical protein